MRTLAYFVFLTIACLLSGCSCSEGDDPGTDSGPDGDGGPTCASGLEPCGAACVDTDSDPAHCGGCNSACSGGEACIGGTCGAGCPADPTPTGDPSSCPSECNGGCAGGTCVIDCPDGLCDSQDIVCPEGFACRVQCMGEDSCDTGSVTCPAMFACTLVCDGHDGCGDLDFNCDSGSCTLECGTDDAACAGTMQHCDSGACVSSCEGTSTPTPDGCTSACACSTCEP